MTTISSSSFRAMQESTRCRVLRAIVSRSGALRRRSRVGWQVPRELDASLKCSAEASARAAESGCVMPVQTEIGMFVLVRDHPRRIEAHRQSRVRKSPGKSLTPAVAVDVDDDVAGVAVRSPQPVVVVSGERGRQAVTRRRRNRSPPLRRSCSRRSPPARAAPGEERSRSRDRCDEFGPAVHVGPILGQRRRAVVLGSHRRCDQRAARCSRSRSSRAWPSSESTGSENGRKKSAAATVAASR